MLEFDSENLYLEACDSTGCKKASVANNYEFQSLNLEDSSLKMRTDVQAIYNIFIKLEVAGVKDVYLEYKSYVCAFKSPENLLPLVLEYTVAWYFQNTTHSS